MEPNIPNTTEKAFLSVYKKKRFPAWEDIIALLGVFFVSTVVAGLLIGLFQRFGSASPGFATFLGYLVQFGSTIAFGLFWRRNRSPETRPLLRFNFNALDFTVILWGVILVFATGIVIEPLLDIFPEMYLDQLSDIMGRGGWMMLTAVVAAPLLEEILFRGIVQDSLTDKYGPFTGILLGSAIFGIIHIIPQQVVNAFLIGIVLGYIYYRTGSLWPVILVHCINNALAYFTWVIGGEQIVGTREQIGDDKIYFVVYGIACAIFVLAFIWMTLSIARAEKKRLKKAEAVGSGSAELSTERTKNP